MTSPEPTASPAAPRPLPLLTDLRDRRVVVVGAGPVAARKVASLIEAGGDIHLVAPDAVDDLAAAAEDGVLAWHRRPYAEGDLAGAFLAVAATADTATNDAVAAEADRTATLCVRVDAGGSASGMASLHRGPIIVAVATGGTSPALAGALRAHLDDVVDEAWGGLAELMAELRSDPRVQAAMAGLDDAERALRWRSVITPDILALIRHDDPSAKDVALHCLCSSTG